MEATKYGMPQLIPLDKIVESPFQVRIDYGDIDALAASIEKYGMQQPVLVRPIGELFETVFGHLRIRAVKKTGTKFILAFVKELSDEDAMSIHGEENIQRRDYSPIEQARYYKKCNELGKTLTQIAKDHKISPVSLKDYLYLLDLPEDIQKRVHSREISFSKATRLAILTRKKITQKERVTTQGFIKAPRTTEHYDDIRTIADDKELRDSVAVEMAAKLVRDGVPLPEAIDMAKKDYARRKFKDRPRALTPAEAAEALEESLSGRKKYEKLGRSEIVKLVKKLLEDGNLECPVCGKCGITWECTGQLIWENLRSDEDV